MTVYFYPFMINHLVDIKTLTCYSTFMKRNVCFVITEMTKY